MNVSILQRVGSFAENTDKAKWLRTHIIVPALRQEEPEEIVLDLDGVSGTTQSFVHALIADAIRYEELSALDHLVFANCNEVVQSVVEVVVEYTQEQWEDPDSD